MTAFAVPNSWRASLASALETIEMAELAGFLDAEIQAGKTIYPPRPAWFRALELTPLDKVRVVILGQDPYHGPGQAHGLAFSVPAGVRPPPSLLNIFKELESDLGIARPRHGCLEHWARQGVLLLNSVLTVEMGRAASHSRKGWEHFTDAIIRRMNDQPEPMVFMLWGAYAHKKAANVDTSRHLVLKAAHPSPLSAYNGFLGSKVFSQCNAFLVSNGHAPIDWTLPDAVQ